MASIFNAHQRSTIEAATGRIIPKDRNPGAIEAGVIDYIENTLGGYDAEYLSLYIDGIRELDSLAREKFGAQGFSSLEPAKQDEVLAYLEENESPFFAHLLEHTMQGFYGDPRHGGNRDRVSWKMIGFPGPAHPEGYQPPFGWYDENVPDEFDPNKKRADDDAEK
jgi:gluconate 2-dehydrogenase gamma chain